MKRTYEEFRQRVLNNERKPLLTDEEVDECMRDAKENSDKYCKEYDGFIRTLPLKSRLWYMWQRLMFFLKWRQWP